MVIIWFLAPLAILMGCFFLGAFIWATRNGQMDDLATPPLRMLLPDEEENLKQEKNNGNH